MANQLKNFRDLNKAHKRFMKESTDDIKTSLERMAIKFFQSLQLHTARDTSRAINGWLPIIDGPPSDWKPPKGQSSYSPKTLEKGRIKFYSMIWIVNNVEYIEPLDDGHSMQFPEGFTTPAIRITILFVESELQKLNRKKYNV